MADICDALGHLREVRRLVAVEERRGLLERAVPRLDDEEVQEHDLEREERAVDDLQREGTHALARGYRSMLQGRGGRT